MKIIGRFILFSLFSKIQGQTINICPTREITLSSGRIVSPNYPNKYPQDINCILTIKQPLDTKFTFNFTKIDIEGGEVGIRGELACYDVLAISGGFSMEFCGTTTPESFTLGLNVVMLKMTSDSAVQQTGFDLSFTTVQTTGLPPAVSVCPTRTITPGAEGRVHSPEYSGNYGVNLNCKLILDVPSDKKVKVMFNYRDIEYSPQCWKDKLVVADKIASRYRCGTSSDASPATYNSDVSFSFTTDSSGSGRGFILTYKLVNESVQGEPDGTLKHSSTSQPDGALKHNSTSQPDGTLKNEGQPINICPTREITSSSGRIISPNYPNNYPPDINCILTIKKPLDTEFTFNFTKMDMESDKDGNESVCYDVLAISGGSSKEFCGTTTPASFTPGLNVVMLQMISDSSVEQTGFDLSFTTVQTTGLPPAVSVCPTRTITPGAVGRVHSPEYSGNYGIKLNCQLTLDVPSDKKVKVTFNYRDIEYSPNCSKDQVLVASKTAARSRCGTSSDASPVTYNGDVAFIFKTDSSGSGRGFMLTYKLVNKSVQGEPDGTLKNNSTGQPHGALENKGQAINICPTREITSSSGRIVSPNYPNNYPPDINCILTIKKPLDTEFTFKFTKIDMEGDKDGNESVCYDVLAISGGSSKEFCGTTTPASFTPGLNVVLLKMTSDSTVQQTGFDLSFTTVQTTGLPPAVSVCPTRTIAPGAVGRVHSPEYGGNYGVNLNCKLTLDVPSDKKVKVMYNYRDIEYSPQCWKDKLLVADKTTSRYTCGTSYDASPATYNGDVSFNFTTNSSGSGRGFILTYKLVNESVKGEPDGTLKNQTTGQSDGTLENNITGQPDGTLKHNSMGQPNIISEDYTGVIAGGLSGAILFVAVVVVIVLLVQRKILKDRFDISLKELHAMHVIRNTRVPVQPSFQTESETADESEIMLSYVALLEDWEIAPDNLKLLDIKLGKGQFGIVRQGLLTTRKGDSEIVAVKTLKDCAKTSDLEDLMAELIILKDVNKIPHPNIVRFVGGCLIQGKLHIVTEFCSGGSLRQLLINSRVDPSENSPDYSNMTSTLNHRELLKFAVDVANGMAHLSSQKMVHRDLAARNILIGADNTAKISDFGLARDIKGVEEYTRSNHNFLPVKWMALESLFYGHFTTASDVWSYGILLHEITTLGEEPYKNIPPHEIIGHVGSGYRMSQTPQCSDEVYEIMTRCWKAEPKERPTFADIYELLNSMLVDNKRPYIFITQIFDEGSLTATQDYLEQEDLLSKDESKDETTKDE